MGYRALAMGISLVILIGLPLYADAKSGASCKKSVDLLYREGLSYVVFIRPENKLPDIGDIEPVSFFGGMWEKFWPWSDKVGKGTAWIMQDHDGTYYVVTHSHVVVEGEQGEPYYVWFHGANGPVAVKKHGWDPLFDWAILTFEDGAFVPPGTATLGDSSTVDVESDETYYALGNPLALKHYWSTGKVMKAASYVARTKYSRIALDMTCNPGNSGSPLVNQCGEVVGGVEAVSDPRRSTRSFCLASPISIFKKLFPRLKAGGEVRHGDLGMAVLNAADFTPGELKKLRLDKTKGDDEVVVVSILPDSPAEHAGIKHGDIILAIYGPSSKEKLIVTNAGEFVEFLHLGFYPGDKVILELWRGEFRMTTTAELGAMPQEDEVQIIIVPPK